MKPEDVGVLVRYRMEQARTALDDARFLLDGGRSPQSVINRAYYAMFYSVLALLQTIGKVPGKHTGAIGLFDTEFVMKNIFTKEMSRTLHKGFELRQTSDYTVPERYTQESASEFLSKEVRFVESVEVYFNPSEQNGAGRNE